MSGRAYIVPNELLHSWLLEAEWHAHVIPGDPSKSLLVVMWDNLNREIEFESLGGVMPLGDPWEQLPADAVPLIASFQSESDLAVQTGVTDVPTVDPVPSTPDTVKVALNKVPWAGGRLVR
jgi:hypothetical protein